MNAIKKDGKYQNLEFIKMTMDFSKAKGMAKDYIKKQDVVPPFKIPRLKIDKNSFKSEDSYIWLGHSTILGHIDEVSFIVDPMLAKRASPFKFMGPKRFEGSLTPLEDLPKIDVILITHNHYDHMQKDTLLALQEQVDFIYVPLDNKKILTKWGIEESKIKEFDWFEDIVYKDLQFSFCPTQHFSGRSLTDRDKYLWGSWAIKGVNHSLYVSGDSGYNQHFSLIGQKYGPFDVACMECGAYNDNWSEIHMTPEQSVQASKDLKSTLMHPMHWASFDLSTHAWDEPITRAQKKAEEIGVITTTPMIGKVNYLRKPLETSKWWKDLG
jgi:L-ascorbate metabolism protein UlaG (beta-lactamase superfamily)